MPKKKAVPDIELNQGEILDQLVAYKELSHQVKFGHSRHALSPAMKADFYHGSCRSFSFLNGYMRLDGHKAFWDFCLRKVALWDRTSDSLNEAFTVPGTLPNVKLSDEARALKKGEYIVNGVGLPEKLTLKEIIKIVKRNVYYAQSKRKSLIENYNGTTDYRFGPEMKYLDEDGDVQCFSKGGYVLGNFDVNGFAQIIQDPKFKAALHGGRICILYSNNHACELYMSATGKYFFYNPNYMRGKAKAFDDMNDLFYAIDRSLGTGELHNNGKLPEGTRIDLGIEFTGEPITDDPFAGYYPLLESQPFELIDFNNRKEKNFAVEWYYADEALREKLITSLMNFSKTMTDENKKSISHQKKAPMINLMKAAVMRRDFKWLERLVSVGEACKMLGQVMLRDVMNVAHTKADKDQIARLFNKRLRAIKTVSLVESSASLFPKKTPKTKMNLLIDSTNRLTLS